MCPFPGTKRPERLEENAAAAGIRLSEQDVAALDQAIPPAAVRGTRYADTDVALLNR